MIYLGSMTVEGYSCKAKFFECEVKDKSGPQLKCCKRGLITLPRRTDPPEVLRRLLTNEDEESKHFRASIYRYNSSLAFASIHAQCPSLEQGAQAFIVQGQMYTTMYPGMPGPNSAPRGNQMYFLEMERGVACRVDSFTGLRPSVVRPLLQMLYEHNPYAAIYETVSEFVRRQQQRSVARVELAMRADLTAVHRGTGGMPSGDEVAVVYNHRNT